MRLKTFASIVDIFIKVVLTLLLCFYIFLVFYHPIEIEDIWWHLSTGRWMTQNLQVPHEDIFSFVENPVHWTFTEWLGTMAYYGVYLLGGFPGLKIFRLFLFFLAFGIFFFYARRKIPYVFLLLLALLITFGLAGRSLLRPLVFNFTFIQIFLIILYSYQKNPNTKKLFLILAIGALWSNIHLGSFIFGSVMIASFLASEVVVFLNSVVDKNKRALEIFKETKIRNLLLTLLCFWLSFSISPYGFEALIYPWKSLLGEYAAFYKFSKIIGEMTSPARILFSFSGWWAYITILFTIIFLKFSKTKNLANIFLFIFSIFFFLYAQRGLGFFIIINVSIILQCANEISFKEKWDTNILLKIAKYIISGLLFLILFLGIPQMISGKITKKIIHDDKETSILFTDEDAGTPYYALKFLEKNKIEGKIFTNDEFGGYILWSAYPILKPLIDTRFINHKVFSNFINIVSYPEELWEQGEEFYGYKIALLRLRTNFFTDLAKYLNKNKDWQLIFVDNFCVIFVKRNHFNLSEDLNRYEERLKNAQIISSDLEKLKSIVFDASGEQKAHFLNIPQKYFIDTVAESSILWELGYEVAAIKKLTSESQAFKNTPPMRFMAHLFLNEINKREEKENNTDASP